MHLKQFVIEKDLWNLISWEYYYITQDRDGMIKGHRETPKRYQTSWCDDTYHSVFILNTVLCTDWRTSICIRRKETQKSFKIVNNEISRL